MKNVQMKKKRLFIISNNTHYLNISNYIKTHDLGENHVIYICKYSLGYREFIKELEHDHSIKFLKVIYHNQKNQFPSNYIFLVRLLIRIKQLGKFDSFYDIIFFSNYLSWIQHLIVRQLDPKKTAEYGLINDGTAIFKTIKLRKRTLSINFPNLNPLVSKFLGSFTIDHLHFYSPIELEVAPQDSLELFYFKASKTANIDLEKIYFVGSDLVELKLLHLEDHLIYLEQIKKNFFGYKIFYFAHRGEKDSLLEKYNFFGTVVKDFIPFEARLEKEKELPTAIISYSSSVLINLPQVYPHIQFYYFPLEKESIPDNSRFKKSYPELLKYFETLEAPNFTHLILERNNID